MDINVLMPFNRRHLVRAQYTLLKDNRINWIPCCDDETIRFPDELWIRPYYSKKGGGYKPGNYSILNQWIATSEVDPYCWYQLADDDGMLTPEFWKGLRALKVNDYTQVIVTSQLRPNGHVIPRPECMRPFGADHSMLCIRGDVLKEERFNTAVWCADGLLAERLAHKHVVYAPTVMGYYNGLRPSQWNNGAWKDDIQERLA